MWSAEQQELHRNRVSGSIMPYVCPGDDTISDERINHVFLVNVGAEPPDEETYQMRAGVHMESFIRKEYARETGRKVSRVQDVVWYDAMPDDVFVTLDGFIEELNAVVEIKFCSPFWTPAQIFAFYYPQVALQMLVTGADRGFLIAAQGTNPPIEIECQRSAEYEAEMIQRIAIWLHCIKTLTPPYPMPIVVPPEKWRTVDLSIDKTNWGNDLEMHLLEYESTKPFAEAHEAAGKAARALVPDDVGRVYAPGGFVLARNKKGTVSITRRVAA